MWLFLNDAFLSIVHKDCARDELLVRARRQGDIEKVFPNAKVESGLRTDYRFRAIVKRSKVEHAMIEETRRITYWNFKDSVDDRPLHDAYLRVWSTMASLQPTRPYAGLAGSFDFGEAPAKVEPGKAAGGHARAKKLTAAQRSEAARHAANVRWGNE